MVLLFKEAVSICFPLVPPIPGPIPDPLLNWVTELSNVTVDRRWVLLTNLKAAASYQFRVSAVNSVGEGPPSEPSNQVMLPQEGKICYFNLFFCMSYELIGNFINLTVFYILIKYKV